ncbi:MAG TPA: hypothetical protein VFK94_02295 [Patescibacteria group bacterium]|nr:hypothetical protein [Patescibacteria group bacterium]
MENVNPLKVLRKDLGYSIDRLASTAHISRQVIMNNEAGQYETPSPALISALDILYEEKYGENLLHAKPHFIKDYHLWQTNTRRSNYGVLVEPLPEMQYTAPLLDSPTHPVVYWASVSNIPYTRISKLFCVHQGLMDRLKNRHYLMNHLPTAFVDALLEAGYRSATLVELEQYFQAFKLAERSKYLKVSSSSKEGLRP